MEDNSNLKPAKEERGKRSVPKQYLLEREFCGEKKPAAALKELARNAAIRAAEGEGEA